MSWIKMETHTPDKPEIFQIAEILSIDPDLVFAKCFRIWAWFDAHTTNGKTNGASVSELLVDRVANVTGFAKAMQGVGWLISDSNGLTLPNFDRHNGETAKGRALTAKRVEKHAAKTNAKTNAAGVSKSVSEALPREDKKLKENIKRKFPSTFTPNEWHSEFAEANGLVLEAEVEKFRDYHEAKGSQFSSWTAAFRTWLRNAVKFRTENRPQYDDQFAGAK